MTGGHALRKTVSSTAMCAWCTARDQRSVLLDGRRDQVDVQLQLGADHLARIAMAGMIVHHEILLAELQHHAIFRQLDAQRAVHHAVHVALRDLARTAEVEVAAALWPRTVGPPTPTTTSFNCSPATRSASRSTQCDALGDRPLVGDHAVRPAPRVDLRVAFQFDAAVLDDADDATGVPAACIEPGGFDDLRCHFLTLSALW